MRTWKHLVKTALSDEAMNAALESAVREKGHRRGVQRVLARKEEVKARIRRWVVTGEYPEVVHRSLIATSGTNKKERVITPPYFTPEMPEQWMHHVLMRAIGPILLHGAYFHSYASVPGKGVHSAGKAIHKFLCHHPQKARYFLRLDIRKFYPGMPTERLKEKLRRVVKDPYILGLAEWVIDQNRIILPDGTEEKRGLLIGFYPSQYFANFYLQDFDHFISEELRPGFYLRYMDDLLLFDSNRRRLKRMGREIEKRLREEGLCLKHPPQVRDRREVTLNIIGLRFRGDRMGIRRPIYARAMRKARRMGKKLPYMDYRDAVSFISYLGWFKITNTKGAYSRWVSENVNAGRCKRLISLAERGVG